MMKTFRIVFALLFPFGLAVSAKAQCGSSIDFSTDWSKKGPSAAGTWVVSGGGSTVTQTINGAPTFYVSGTNYIDVVINGTFKVNTTNDDDWVGFVFGYNDPITPGTGPNQNYYLFDWKQADQTGTGPSCYSLANEGFSLVKVDTSIDLTNTCAMEPMYWDHNSYPGFNVIATDYSTTNGWGDLTTYNFSLTYTSKLIVIVIEGDTIFNIPGCYEPGRFGFYNLSQDQAVYSNFSYQLVADFDFVPSETCINTATDFNAVNDACLTGPYVSPIINWDWDMGDGTTINDTNITYTYNEPGTYDVTLTVSDAFGCVTPVTKPFVVRGLKAYQTETIICPASSTQIWCNHAQSGALYQWFKDGVAVTSPTALDTTYTVTSTGVYHVEMTNFGSYLCNTVSNNITVTQENLTVTIASGGTTVCSGTPVNFTTASIAGAAYEWFVNGISQGVGTNSFSTSTTGTVYVEVTTTNGCTFQSNTITLTTGTTPTASISSAATGFCPGGSVNFSTTLLAGETIQWNLGGSPIAGATSPSYTANAAGTYTATVTNSAGCSDVSNSISIVVYSVPTATITSSEPNFCPGITSITLTSNTVAGGSYQWLLNGSPVSGATSSTYNTTATGDYQVVVTNASGCSTTSAITTLQNATVSTFTVNAAASSFCSGSTVNITATNESGSVYTWYNGSTSVAGPTTDLTSYNASSSGSYYVEVTNSMGCSTYSDTVAVTAIPLPTASISTLSTSICPGDSTLLSAVYVSGATYQWYHNGSPVGAATVGATNFYASASGTYSVVVNDGCSKTSNVITISNSTLPAAASSIFGATTFCEGESEGYGTFTVSGATYYNWTITPASAASIASGQGTTSIVVNPTNVNFTLTVTPQNSCGNGASTSYPVALETTPGWCIGVLFAANKTNICTGSTVVFTNYTDESMYFGAHAAWNFGAGASPATATGFGPHTVTYSTNGLKTVVLKYVDDFSGFTIDDNTKTNYINVNGSVSTSAITGNSAVACSSPVEVYSVTNTVGSTYAWSVPAGAVIVSGAGTNLIQVDLNGNSGTISVTETNVTGCVGSPVTKAVTITGAPTTSSISGPLSFPCSSDLENYTVTNTSGSTYTWSVPTGAVILSGQGTNAIQVDFNGNNGVVTVTETNAAGCSGSPVTITVNCTLGITELNAQMLNVYPNPANDVLIIDNVSAGDLNIVLYDANGRQVNQRITAAQGKITLDVHNLERGTYLGKAQGENQSWYFRFVKM